MSQHKDIARWSFIAGRRGMTFAKFRALVESMDITIAAGLALGSGLLGKVDAMGASGDYVELHQLGSREVKRLPINPQGGAEWAIRQQLLHGQSAQLVGRSPHTVIVDELPGPAKCQAHDSTPASEYLLSYGGYQIATRLCGCPI